VKSNCVPFLQLRILGNHQVLHKYLNRNTLFVATTTPTNTSKPVDESAVVAYLLDTVTGRVLHRVSHQGVQVRYRGRMFDWRKHAGI
jgi:hypothetical protein